MSDRPNNLAENEKNIFDLIDGIAPDQTEKGKGKAPVKQKKGKQQEVKYYSDKSDEDNDDDYAPFDIDSMSFPAVIVALGKPKRGKSHLVRWLVTYFSVVNKKFKWIRVFTGSKYNEDYDFLPEYAVSDYAPEKLQTYHEKLIETRQNRTKEDMPLNVIIFDDLLGKLQADSTFDGLISTYRHTNTTIILANQYVKTRSSSASLRSFTTYAFLFKALDQNSIKAYYEWFNGGAFDNYADYKKHFLATTKDKYTAMLFIEQEDNPNRNFYSFKAPEDSLRDVQLKF